MAVPIWTNEDTNAARVMTRVWRWRIYVIALVALAVVAVVLISKT